MRTGGKRYGAHNYVLLQEDIGEGKYRLYSVRGDFLGEDSLWGMPKLRLLSKLALRAKDYFCGQKSRHIEIKRGIFPRGGVDPNPNH